MKYLGAGLLWTSLICVGATYSINLKKRINLLENTVLMIEEMKIQLSYLNLPIYDILKTMKDKDYLKILSFIGASYHLMESGYDFNIAWQMAIEDTRLQYKREEKERLLHLGMNLGVSDTDNQLCILNLDKEYFLEYISKAKLKDKKYGNLTMSLGVLSGCMIFVLLL